MSGEQKETPHRAEAKIEVPTRDPVNEKAERDALKPQHEQPPNPELTDDKQSLKDEEEKDAALRKELDMMVERLQESNEGIQKAAIDAMTKEIRTSTSSMTSVPKPLKLLKPHYETIKKIYEKFGPTNPNKVPLADVLSVLAMTMAKPNTRESLQFKLLGSKEAITLWGHEYVRHLTGEIGKEFEIRSDSDANVDDLIKLVEEIVPFNMTHNAEHEAADLLLEVDQVERIVSHTTDKNFPRVCLYLAQCASYLTEPDDTRVLNVVTQIYRKHKQYPSALRMALRMNNRNLAEEIYKESDDKLVKIQMAFMLGRHQLYLEDNDNQSMINNSNLSEYFLALGKDLDVVEAKEPEDVYKSKGGETRQSTVDSARQNLASTFVNAFINAGFGQDKLMTKEGSKWIFKNKDHGMMSAAASLGFILLWDVDTGINQIDKYLYANDENIQAGALLAIGIVNSGVRSEMDPALALLTDHASGNNNNLKAGAILGLGLAYAGTARQDVADLLLPSLEDSGAPMDVIGLAALALGMVFVGTANPELTESMIAQLMERSEAMLNVSHARFIALGLGLLYLGKQQAATVAIEMLKTVSHSIGKYASLTVEGCAYVGSGNVLKVQKFLDICGDHPAEEAKNDASNKDSKENKSPQTPAQNQNNAAAQTDKDKEKEKEKDGKYLYQAVSALNIAMVAMGEEVGSDMVIRSFEHLLQYGEQTVRRSVPLCFALLSLCNPKLNVVDTLSRLTHDSDEEVACGAIFALGLVGAGTNNAKIAGLLKSLANYYYKEPNHLFLVRIAQGMLFLGKGTISIAPYHSDRMLMSNVAMSGILAVLHSCLDFKSIIFGKYHYMLYSIVTAMSPRLLMTLEMGEDGKLKQAPLSVRVGTAVDVVGTAGKPKTITGFQTHTTPVLLGWSERAELATDDYIALTPILEGFVVVKKNPDAEKNKKGNDSKKEVRKF